MKITIDRFEGNYAVCEMENGNFANLPKEFLPSAANEGSKLVIELDLDSEAEDRDRVRSKMDNLFKK